MVEEKPLTRVSRLREMHWVEPQDQARHWVRVTVLGAVIGLSGLIAMLLMFLAGMWLIDIINATVQWFNK